MNIYVCLNVQFVELHGDRAGYDDPAIVTGIGTIDGRRYMFMGHQKGRNTKENIMRNFGMPTPHGYVQLHMHACIFNILRSEFMISIPHIMQSTWRVKYLVSVMD